MTGPGESALSGLATAAGEGSTSSAARANAASANAIGSGSTPSGTYTEELGSAGERGGDEDFMNSKNHWAWIENHGHEPF
jgi:hypothetical protein